MTIINKLFSFATLTLLVALALSTIAAWYSIQGLMAIFAAAITPIIIMGSALEVAKVVTAVWLHNYWERSSWKLKIYLIPAVIALAFLTSMGIFGYLSKSHSDQALVSGDVQAKISVFDEKIKTARENIESNKTALKQLNTQVDQLVGRTTDEKGIDRSVTVRRQQASERTKLNKEIATAQSQIAKLNEEAAPIRAQIRKVEAEVGPIKYIAALIYGDNPDSNLLERAVRWMIVLIVFVFDPLALMLVLAAQSSYGWLEEDRIKKTKEEILEEPMEEPAEEITEHPVESAIEESIEPSIEQPIEEPIEEPIEQPIEEPVLVVEEPILETTTALPTVEEIAVPKKSDVEEIVTLIIDGLNKRKNKLVRPIKRKKKTITELTADGSEIIHAEVDDEVRVVKQPEIKTEGVTYRETEGGYIQYEGKSIQKAALQGMHPNLFAARPDNVINTNFGSVFPKFSSKGDIFVRVDALPNRVYKFDGAKWIEVNKEQTDSYLYDEAYISFLVDKISKGEYDLDLLTEHEKVEIENYLKQHR